MVYDALAAGLPGVAYDLPTYGVFEDVVRTVPLGDVEGAAREVVRLLADEQLRDEPRRRARKARALSLPEFTRSRVANGPPLVAAASGCSIRPVRTPRRDRIGSVALDSERAYAPVPQAAGSTECPSKSGLIASRDR